MTVMTAAISTPRRRRPSSSTVMASSAMSGQPTYKPSSIEDRWPRGPCMLWNASRCGGLHQHREPAAVHTDGLHGLPDRLIAGELLVERTGAQHRGGRDGDGRRGHDRFEPAHRDPGARCDEQQGRDDAAQTQDQQCLGTDQELRGNGEPEQGRRRPEWSRRAPQQILDQHHDHRQQEQPREIQMAAAALRSRTARNRRAHHRQWPGRSPTCRRSQSHAVHAANGGPRMQATLKLATVPNAQCHGRQQHTQRECGGVPHRADSGRRIEIGGAKWIHAARDRERGPLQPPNEHARIENATAQRVRVARCGMKFRQSQMLPSR